MKKNIHITPRKEGWAVKPAGAQRASKIVSTQKEAIGIGRKMAKSQKSELLIHRTNGEIRDKHSYGNDPYPPKG